MIEIARLPADDRRELFHNTAAKTGLHDAIVEKDFWVCLTLDYLFHRSPWKRRSHLRAGPAYPNLFTDASTLQVIRLEIGALAAWTPAELVDIVPYAAEQYPQLFKQKEVPVLTVAPERTFWEKATILHHEANRPEHLSMPQRYSRHYYDLYCMAKSPVKEKAFERLDLLQKVVDFKMKFYPRAWARYPEAVPATLKLLPPSYRLGALQEDYSAMRNMLYGEIPSFETMMEAVGELEKEIHAL